jgi:hypothetical protein
MSLCNTNHVMEKGAGTAIFSWLCFRKRWFLAGCGGYEWGGGHDAFIGSTLPAEGFAALLARWSLRRVRSSAGARESHDEQYGFPSPQRPTFTKADPRNHGDYMDPLLGTREEKIRIRQQRHILLWAARSSSCEEAGGAALGCQTVKKQTISFNLNR